MTSWSHWLLEPKRYSVVFVGFKCHLTLSLGEDYRTDVTSAVSFVIINVKRLVCCCIVLVLYLFLIWSFLLYCIGMWLFFISYYILWFFCSFLILCCYYSVIVIYHYYIALNLIIFFIILLIYKAIYLSYIVLT